jgi:hypothetical protein
MRRIEAMTPYKEGLREAVAWLKRAPGAVLAMNQVVTTSMRFMLEAANIDLDGGAAAAIKVQGLALAWARVLAVWLDDDDPGLSKTMAELDRELTRGERAVAGVNRLNDFARLLRSLAQAAFDARRRMRERPRRGRRSDEEPDASDETGDASLA